MGLLSNCLTLREMQSIIQSEVDDISILGNLDISFSDYQLLSNKIITLINLDSNAAIIENYALSLMTYIVFSIQYKEDDIEYVLIDYFQNLPQYRQKHFLNMFRDVVYEYGLSQVDDSNFDASINGLKTLIYKQVDK